MEEDQNEEAHTTTRMAGRLHDDALVDDRLCRPFPSCPSLVVVDIEPRRPRRKRPPPSFGGGRLGVQEPLRNLRSPAT